MSGTGPVNAHLSEDAWRDAAALVAAYMRMDDEGQDVIVRHADPAALTAGAVAMAASVLAGWAISLGVGQAESFGWIEHMLSEALAGALGAGQEG